MDGEGNGGQAAAAQQQAAGAEDAQAQQGQVTASGSGEDGGATASGVGASGAGAAVDYEAVIRERDGRIAELEAQVAEAAKSAEAADELRGQIAELKQQSADERVEFELTLAGVRNVKAAKALLGDHGGDVSALREAEPWLFAKHAAEPTGATGLPSAGASSDEGRTLKRWRSIAGLDDDKERRRGDAPFGIDEGLKEGKQWQTASHSRRTTRPSSTRCTRGRRPRACSTAGGAWFAPGATPRRS